MQIPPHFLAAGSQGNHLKDARTPSMTGPHCPVKVTETVPREQMSQENQWCNHLFKWIQNGWSNADLWLLFWLPSIKFSLGCPLNISQCLVSILKRTASHSLLFIASHKPELKVGHVSHTLIPLPPIPKSHHLSPVAHPESASCSSVWLERQRWSLAVVILLDKGQLFWESLLMTYNWLISCFSLPPGALKCRTESRKGILEN